MRKMIMLRAWELYRLGNCTLRAEFAVALSMAWAESKAPKMEAPKRSLVDFLLAHGARRWTKGGHDRLYFGRDMLPVFGYKATDYRRPGGHGQSINGVGLSSNSATKIVRDIVDAYYDVKAKKIVWGDGSDVPMDVISDSVDSLFSTYSTDTAPTPAHDGGFRYRCLDCGSLTSSPDDCPICDETGDIVAVNDGRLHHKYSYLMRRY